MKTAEFNQQRIRSFSRDFTEQMGLLREEPYDSELNLLESRIIFELSLYESLLARDLAAILSIDKGYLSRVLTGMKKKLLLKTKSNTLDSREKRLYLTAKGQKKFREIDGVSRERTLNLLESLGAQRGLSLVHSLTTAQIALGKSPIKPSEVVLRDLEPGDLGWVIGRHGEIYFTEYQWNMDFEVLVAEIATAFVKKHDPKYERAWIAELRGVRLGSIFLVHESDQTAKLRILLVDPMARGLGIGSRLVQECISFARKAGYSRIVLWTNSVLTSARKIYQAEGFHLEKEEAHHSFGKKLVGQYWAKEL
ncbi:MAG TPA: helix-turn-helix domain-containing GNAT family N-acetyltransferase [Bdellovibrio sp.]|uniref:helix-turn-helix domain-containing GNAT family N-acetyltransferase n=1 Tax=Bdellovibrio sp. TaxID=28201 RepID=UPI002F1D8B35